MSNHLQCHQCNVISAYTGAKHLQIDIRDSYIYPQHNVYSPKRIVHFSFSEVFFAYPKTIKCREFPRYNVGVIKRERNMDNRS